MFVIISTASCTKDRRMSRSHGTLHQPHWHQAYNQIRSLNPTLTLTLTITPTINSVLDLIIFGAGVADVVDAVFHDTRRNSQKLTASIGQQHLMCQDFLYSLL